MKSNSAIILYLNGPFILDNDATISYEMQSVSIIVAW